MEILNLIYKVFIGPLELFFEIIFSMAYRLIGSPVLAIVFLSLAMNFLVLPLYRRADAMQEAERDRVQSMKHWTDHIKKTFTGDERFMMLQTYNRQNGYKQTDVFKGSISLLLEIPFFIAAFHFLSNLQLLNGVPLGPIADLGAPDGLLQLGGISINILPILMTVINVVSAAIYLKGFPLNSKIQTYGIAAIFLILLYASPSGLVFYWTLNNLFSLVKNIFYKLKNPRLILCILASVTSLALLVMLLIAPLELTPLRIAVILIFAIGLQIPLISYFLRNKIRISLPIPNATESDNKTFLLGCFILAVLIGALIPISVIQASPEEFVDTISYRSPLWFVAESFALALGTFVLWFGVFYWLATPKGKTIFNYLIFIAIGTGIVNYLFFGTDYGNLSALLQFDSNPVITPLAAAINLAVVAAVAIILLVVWRLKNNIVRVAYFGLSIAVVAMSVIGSVSISNSLGDAEKAAILAEQADRPTIPLSTNGKNVVVIMLDRAVPYFIPYLINEKPELTKLFDGFTSYQNALAYGPITNIGAPPLYGGSEYRPIQMNERDNLPLMEKHHEALKIMPRLFSENGFNVTVFDPTYAGYSWIPDLTVFDDVPGVKTYRTMDGSFLEGKYQTEERRTKDNSVKARNFFCYSLFKTSPLVLQPTIYQDGVYNSASTTNQVRQSTSRSVGLNPGFMKPYAVLDSMPDITKIKDDTSNNFLMMSNDTTHEPALLQEPNYEPAEVVNNDSYDKEHATRKSATGDALHFDEGSFGHQLDLMIHYQINMAAMLKLGEWCEYLRENGVYDNTRIIIVSDHSWAYLMGNDMNFSIWSPYNNETVVRDVRAFNCVFMVKDYNAKGFKLSDQFITNAETPVMAFDGLINNPVNPFTGNPIDSSYLNEPEQYVMYSTDWHTSTNNGNRFLPGQWFSIHDDVRVRDNWEYLYEE